MITNTDSLASCYHPNTSWLSLILTATDPIETAISLILTATAPTAIAISQIPTAIGPTATVKDPLQAGSVILRVST